MALVDEALKQVEDDALRVVLQKEVETLRGRVTFGLVFDRHIPETTNVARAPIQVGTVVQRRDQPASEEKYVVLSISNGTAHAEHVHTQEDVVLPLSHFVAVKRIGDPVYPGLVSLGEVRRSDLRPYHTVINGENFHVLQLLAVFGETSVDCIYLDPPYNTGAATWKYNNRFVDSSDGWRHSKWLSMMERRLTLSRSLLKPDGILVVSIDENEHAHLVCLIEDMFKGWDITSVAVVSSPRGHQGDNFSYSNDFAVFVTPPGKKVITPLSLDGARPLTAQKERRFRAWGDESKRTTAKNCFFPIYVQEEGIVGFGPVPPDDFHPEAANVDVGKGRYEVWPIDSSGVERKWRNQRKTIEEVAHLLSVETVKGRLEIRIDKETATHKTVWTGSRYDGGSHGKRLLKAFGVDFDYPKSLYTMRDILYACTGSRKNATILDFFAGSGTTLHATCLLNSEDGGTRRCILITNNEVGLRDHVELTKKGIYPGDAAYEERGIFQAVARPRCEAVVTGVRPDGIAVPGLYETGRARGAGFDENVEFLDLVYLDPDDVELGREGDSLWPMLWLAAGARTSRTVPRPKQGYMVDAGNHYAVLFDDERLHEFAARLASEQDGLPVFHLTNDEDAFIELTALLGGRHTTRMLYRDYLVACRTNGQVS
jgi:adenine-specific DNA-methyltransferase